MFKPAEKAVVEQNIEVPVNPNTNVATEDFIVDSIAKTYLKQQNTASLSIGIIRDGKAKSYFYGEITKGSGTAPTAKSLYEIGSITKVFTAILLSNLVENGTVTLDQPIALFLPDTLKKNEALAHITFRMLANHTSGLPAYRTTLKK